MPTMRVPDEVVAEAVPGVVAEAVPGVVPEAVAGADGAGAGGAAPAPPPQLPEEVMGGRYRAELLAHCYRMTGSVHDAEDLVQETYLRAWRAFHTYEGRSSLRTWLHRIATNACLSALEGRRRRPLPTGLGAGACDPWAELSQDPEVPWLEPVPDALVGAAPAPGDPATVVTTRESVRLAFVAALQHLPPRQRAVLLLRDVLAWRAAEVAELLGTSTAAVNSALQRARAQLQQLQPDVESTPEPQPRELQDLLERYVAAFERYDVGGLVELLTADAVWEMPPFTGWYCGAAAVVELIATRCPASARGDMRLVPTAANGQPAFGLYMRGDDGVHRAFHLQVLTLRGARVSHVGAFFDTSLFSAFGLPPQLPAPGPATPNR